MVAIDPPSSVGSSTEIGRSLPRLSVGFVGDTGFARTTVAVEHAETGSPSRRALYDILFPVEAEARINASIESAAKPGTARVRVQVDSGAESSTSFVEPDVPFLAEGARVIWETTCPPGRLVADGEETELGYYSVRAGTRTSRVAIRILLSKRPTGPRLKPEGKPSP